MLTRTAPPTTLLHPCTPISPTLADPTPHPLFPRLRQQQLSALQELLRSEVAAVEGTPLQLSAVQQALSLLAQSLSDMELAAAAIAAGRALGDASAVASTVSSADARAEDVSRMARQLLGVLREFPRRQAAEGGGLGGAQGRAWVRGAPVCCGRMNMLVVCTVVRSVRY